MLNEYAPAKKTESFQDESHRGESLTPGYYYVNECMCACGRMVGTDSECEVIICEVKAHQAIMDTLLLQCGFNKNKSNI